MKVIVLTALLLLGVMGISTGEAASPFASSDLHATDPELMEIFERFTFEEAMKHGKLDEKTRYMAVLASLTAQNAPEEYRTMLASALDAGLPPIEAKETVYQTAPYCGFARVLGFVRLTNEVLKERGVKLPLEGQSSTDTATRFDKGLAVQKGIFGAAIDKIYESSPANQLHIAKYLSANCFGDYYTRGTLDLQAREIVTFCVLASLGGCDSQLKGHINGNIAVGNDKETLLAVVTQLLPWIGYPRTLNAIAAINEVIPEPAK